MKVNRNGLKISQALDAKDLYRRSLSVHGTHNDIQKAFHSLDKAIKAKKKYELMVYPGKQYGSEKIPGRMHLIILKNEFRNNILKTIGKGKIKRMDHG